MLKSDKMFPHHVDDGGWIEYEAYWEGTCPVCHQFVDSSHNFCKRCGQALSWPDSPKDEEEETDDECV